eukprot:c14146_g1_i4.p1 GENE.c14146_g1_i4~~c14146_g1_i4.p1  ORF type:complete len:588 (-),score=198.56 c14146_g1_i4:7-1770(-)
MQGSAKRDDNPVKALIDDLKSEDPAQRIASLRKLNVIAAALGPDRTRSELIPFLQDSIDDEDEVLVVLATELGKIVSEVGGADHAKCLFPPLEQLAQLEEVSVRDQAVNSISQIANIISTKDNDDVLVPMIRKLTSSDWFTSKISATALLPVAYQKTQQPELRSALRKNFVDLSEDDSPMVRRALSTNFFKFALAVESEHLYTTIIPVFLKLAEDEQDSVRLLAVENCVSLGKLLGNGVTVHILPTFKACVTAKSWRVRYMAADHFVSMCQLLDRSVVETELSPMFLNFLFRKQEPEAEVRTAAARHVSELSKLLPQSIISSSIIPAVTTATSDPSQHVRAALASVIMGLAPLCGHEETVEKLVPLFLQLLKDDIPEVRLNIISSIQDLNQEIVVQTLGPSLLPAIVELAADKQWRVRLTIIERIPLLAKQLGVGFFDERLSDLCFSWLGDCVFSIREAAVKNLRQFTEIFGIPWTTQSMIPKIIKLKEHKNYLYRITTLYAITTLADVVGSDVCVNQLVPVTIEFCNDPVPNIRFTACKTLGAILNVVNPENKVAIEKIKETLNLLLQDSDVDVKHFAYQSLSQIK